MSLDWSFFLDRCFRRCQREFFFRELAAWHNAKDPLRRESFLLKQLKTVELWQGLLVHRGIEIYVVPSLLAGSAVDWDRTITGTIEMARRQLEFSRARRYREEKMLKTKAGDDYCALLCHEQGADLSQEAWDEISGTIERAFRNLSQLDELWKTIGAKDRYWSELPIHLKYDGANIVVRLDLLCFYFGKPTIVDWKVSESKGGSDARLQLGLYAWALCKHPSWRVNRIEDVQLLEVQLLTPAVVRHQFDDALAVELENRIFRSLDEIRALCGDGEYEAQDVTDFALARNANSCAYCPFQRPCIASLATPAPVEKATRVQLPLFV
jgi:hypothetical protein